MKFLYIVVNSVCLLIILVLASLVIMWGYLCGLKMFAFMDSDLHKEIVSNKNMLSDFIFKSKIHLLYVKERVNKLNEENEENITNLDRSLTNLESNIEGVKEKNETSCFILFDNETCAEWMVQRLELCAYLKPSYDKITKHYIQQMDTIIQPIFPWSKEILGQFEDFQNNFHNVIKIYTTEKLYCEALFFPNGCIHRNNLWTYGQFKNITSQLTSLSAAISTIKNVSIVYSKLLEMSESSMWHDLKQTTNNYLTCLNRLSLM